MQVNEHLECFSQRLLSVHRKGLPGNGSKVSQPALIGQSQAGFVWRCWPAEVYTTCLFLLSRAAQFFYICFCALPAGNWGVRYNKEGDWGVLSSGLWFINLRSFKFEPNSMGLWRTLWGVILKHRTIRIHQSPVFFNCWRTDNIQHGAAKGRETKAH